MRERESNLLSIFMANVNTTSREQDLSMRYYLHHNFPLFQQVLGLARLKIIPKITTALSNDRW
jgi:hypothetical protein